MKIRIAVAIDSSGEWNSAGCSGLMDSEAMALAVEPLDEEARYFVEAEIEVPGEPPVIVGKIEKAS